MSRTRNALLATLILLASLAPGFAGASHELSITGFSPSEAGPGVMVDVYGSGFANLTSFALIGTTHIYNPNYTLVSDGHLRFNTSSITGPSDRFDIVVANADNRTGLCCFGYMEADGDMDGWPASADCDDTDASINPGAPDPEGDGIDQDCNGVDGSDPPTIWGFGPSAAQPGSWVYVSGRGFHGVANVTLGNASATFFLTDGTQLRFEVPSMAPGSYPLSLDGPGGNTSVCCFRVMGPDRDFDGWDETQDCDDADPLVHPGARDYPGDGVDQDCDGVDNMLRDFRVTLKVSGPSSDEATFGVHPNGTSGFDVGLDEPEPPAPITGNFVQAFFHYPENAPAVQDLSTSVLGPGVEASYPLRVQWSTPSNGSVFQISWDTGAISKIPYEWNVLLRTGDVPLYDMRTNCCYAFYDANATGTMDFEILVTPAVREWMYLPSGWSLMSLPITPLDPSPDAVFAGLADAVYTWTNGSYVAATEIRPGVGYWVHNPSGSASWTLYGYPAHHVTLELNAGWNLVGAPQQMGRLDAAPSHVSRTAWAWDGASYWNSNGILYAHWGYWLYSHEQGATFTVEGGQPYPTPAPVPPPSSSPAPSMRLATPSVGPDASEAPAGEYALALALSTTDGAADGAELVAMLGASARYDGALDVVEAPRPAASTWAQAFLLDSGLQLHRSVVPAGEASQVLRVERAGDAGEATLSWEGARFAEGYAFELVDGKTRIDMRSQTSHTWTVPEGASAREMHVVVRLLEAPLCLVALEGDCLAALPFDPLAERR